MILDYLGLVLLGVRRLHNVMCSKTRAQAPSKGTGLWGTARRINASRVRWNASSSRYLGYGYTTFLLVPHTASAHTSAPGYFEQLRTMTGQGPDPFCCVVLNFGHFVVFCFIVFYPSPVLPAIAEDRYRFLFLSPAEGKSALSLLYILEVGSCTVGSHLSSCVHSVTTCNLVVALVLTVLANLVPRIALGRGMES